MRFKNISPKFLFMQKSFGNNPFTLLDVGAGNRSASRTTESFPNCTYYGLDITRDYNVDEADFSKMKDFYEMDLTKLEFDAIPNNFFDGIWIVHVIEHLHNGDKVLEGLMPKLKKGGLMYVEYPGARSTKLPSMEGTLNFYDDDTHVRIYDYKTLGDMFRSHQFEVLSAGTRRNIYYILAFPLRVVAGWLKGKKLQGNLFWDILGFAEYLYVKKK